ncbi:UNVERIFIED_CONTAM: hypothetical protein GTU68_053765 [Idotea baltica]|nr:hypothetical protein [Idotea baltica]
MCSDRALTFLCISKSCVLRAWLI